MPKKEQSAQIFPEFNQIYAKPYKYLINPKKRFLSNKTNFGHYSLLIRLTQKFNFVNSFTVKSYICKKTFN